MSAPRCTHCGASDFKKDGKTNNVQKYKCRVCHRSFSDKVRKFTYEDKERFLNMYLNNVGVRKSAQFIGCSASLIVRWIRELSNNLKRQTDNAKKVLDEGLPDVIEMDEIYTRIKKGDTECRYGLLILEGEVRLLHIQSAKKVGVQQSYMKK